MNVKDNVAIVTGSTRGIGLVIAKTLAAHGANIVCCSRSEENSKKIAEEIQTEFGVKTLGLKTDISSAASCQELIKSTLETFSKIDILVNNAGITKDNLLLRLKEEDWIDVINTNLNSAFYTTKAVLKPMLRQKFGRIINISSVVGKMGNPGQSNYSAAKAGIIGFTKSIAKEISAKGITVNAVTPGFIETDMIESLPEEYLDNIIKQIPVKRLGQSQEVADLVLFLASDKASYITGQAISVDGGIYM